VQHVHEHLRSPAPFGLGGLLRGGGLRGLRRPALLIHRYTSSRKKKPWGTVSPHGLRALRFRYA
jgi:hypothetical protein